MTTNRRETPTDVLIVGAGPVGLGLAIDLAQRGVTSRVIERATTLHHIPKGQNLTQRSGEHFRCWGISQAVRNASPIPHDFGNAGVVAYDTLLGEYHYDWFMRSAVNRYYFAENERLPQYALEHVLRQRAAELDEIIIHYGCRATAVTQNNNGVSVAFDTADGNQQRAEADYVIGCDGARSLVREAAGIEQDIDPHDRRMALLVFRSMELHNLLERFPGKSIFNILNPELDGYWRFLGRVDLQGTWFYHAPVPADTTADNFDFHAYLHAAIGAKFTIDFEHIGFWDLRIAIARTYQNQRIFIAGDAAHSHPPYGGYGVNNGFEDVRNLSWKLAATLSGWAGPRLLDSYSLERRPVFESTSRDFIERMIRDDRAFCEAYSPDKNKTEFEAAWAQRAQAGNTAVTQYLPHYAASPLVCGQTGARSGASGEHLFKARAGYHLAPQALASANDLFQQLGKDFTLLNLQGDSKVSQAFRRAADDLHLPLIIVSEDSAAARAVYEASYILVRPDHFVAWAGNDTRKREYEILNAARGEF